MSVNERGIPVVVTGPSGAGKGTIVKDLMTADTSFVKARSATTREYRPEDPNEVKYVFYSREQFEEAMRTGEVIEHTVYAGEYYGTLAGQVDEALDAGNNVILEIDVNGAMQIKKLFPEAVLILLLPEDFPTLERRLRDRKTETEEKIVERLSEVKYALGFYYDFDYVVINREGEQKNTVADILSAVRSAKLSVKRNPGILKSFYSSITI